MRPYCSVGPPGLTFGGAVMFRRLSWSAFRFNVRRFPLDVRRFRLDLRPFRLSFYPPKMAPFGFKLWENAFQTIPDISFFDAEKTFHENCLQKNLTSNQERAVLEEL